jgi:hypothetical protein
MPANWSNHQEAVPVYGVNKPESFEVVRQNDSLTMRFPLISPTGKLQALIIAVVVDFLVLISILSLLKPGGLETGVSNMVLCGFFAVPFALIVTLYVVIAFVNTAQISADHQNVCYTYGPITLGTLTIRASEIQQVFVKQEHRSRKHRSYFLYHVCFILANGNRKAVVRGLRNSDHALYIEQELEDFLNIKHAVVRGGFQ